MSELTRQNFRVGRLIRRHFRVQLDTVGALWAEHKGPLESVFVVRGSEPQLRAVASWVESINAPAASVDHGGKR